MVVLVNALEIVDSIQKLWKGHLYVNNSLECNLKLINMRKKHVFVIMRYAALDSLTLN